MFFLGLLKLSNVYGNKKIATIEDLPENARINESEHNIYQLWKIILGMSEFMCFREASLVVSSVG